MGGVFTRGREGDKRHGETQMERGPGPSPDPDLEPGRGKRPARALLALVCACHQGRQ